MKRGDVVVIDHPYTDASGSKVRPAVVVQSDRDNGRLTNTIVALITRNISRTHESTQLLIDLSSTDGLATGLHQTSVVVCTNLFTVSQTRILRVIGSLSGPLTVQLDQCLKVALDLS
jgi:mRNA-degrading endonuclease toxin of MazEF toxin-antitoxin module